MIHIEDLCADDVFTEQTKILSVSDNSPTVYKIFRLFTGQVKLSCEITGRSCLIENDTIELYYEKCSENFIERIANYVVREEEEVDSLSWLVNGISNHRLKHKNVKYFQELYDEICNYSFAVANKNYVAAFIHEYRIIEYIAYAYPLIYAVRSHDFYMTFGHLKKFVENQGKGELGFFKEAINKIFKGDDILSTSFDISLSNITDSTLREAYNRVLNTNIHSKCRHESTTDDLFAIKFNEVGSVLIELRNKIFHHSVNTPNNLLASELYDLNYFMELIVPTFFTWLGIVYLEVFKSIITFETNSD